VGFSASRCFFSDCGFDFLNFFGLILDFSSSTLSGKQSKLAVKLLEPPLADNFSVIIPLQSVGQEWSSDGKLAKRKINVSVIAAPAAAVLPVQECAGSAPAAASIPGRKLICSVIIEFQYVFSRTAEMPVTCHGVEHHHGRVASVRSLSPPGCREVDGGQEGVPRAGENRCLVQVN
jgi:hypothetical protein